MKTKRKKKWERRKRCFSFLGFLQTWVLVLIILCVCLIYDWAREWGGHCFCHNDPLENESFLEGLGGHILTRSACMCVEKWVWWIVARWKELTWRSDDLQGKREVGRAQIGARAERKGHQSLWHLSSGSRCLGSVPVGCRRGLAC